MTATIRVPVEVIIDADPDEPRGFIFVRHTPDDRPCAADTEVRGALAMSEFEAALTHLLARPRMGYAVDVGSAAISREYGAEDEYELTIRPDSFQEETVVTLDTEALEKLLEDVRRLWNPRPEPKGAGA